MLNLKKKLRDDLDVELKFDPTGDQKLISLKKDIIIIGGHIKKYESM